MLTNRRSSLSWFPVVALVLLCGWLAAIARAETSPVVRVVVISDINGRYGSVGYHPRVGAAINRIIKLNPDIVLSTGDMVAGQRPEPKLTRTELEAMWERFHRDVRQPLEQAGIPVIMTPGNHDASAYPAFQIERQVYVEYHRAHPPTIAPLAGGNFPFHYRVQPGDIAVISLDATRPGPFPAAQLDWLTQNLEAGPSIVLGHLPLQPIAIGREREVISDPGLEKLLANHGEVTYLSGHHHAYYPGQRLGIDMLAVGNLGGNQRQLIGTRIRTGFSFALLEYQGGKLTRLQAFVGPDFTRPLDHALLPDRLGTGAQRLNLREGARPTTGTPDT